jgi:hypothetical protein
MSEKISKHKNLLVKVIGMELGLFLVSGLIAVSESINIGAPLFMLGLLCASIGGALFGPRQHRYGQSIPTRDINYFEQRSPDELTIQVDPNSRKPAFVISMGGAMLCAGIPAVVIGLFLLSSV